MQVQVFLVIHCVFGAMNNVWEIKNYILCTRLVLWIPGWLVKDAIWTTRWEPRLVFCRYLIMHKIHKNFNTIMNMLTLILWHVYGEILWAKGYVV